MSHTVLTMPEAKFRSTKKRTQSNRSSLPSHAERPMYLVNGKTMAGAALVSAANSSSFKGVSKPVSKPASKAGKEKAAARETKSFFNPVTWWPVAVGLFLCGFVEQWHTMATQAGIWALRLAFPLTLLATHREIGMDAHFAAMAPQLAMYVQLPLEGFLTKLTLDRGMGVKAAVVQLMGVHAICLLVLWLLSMNVR